jgi:hypothetical protein
VLVGLGLDPNLSEDRSHFRGKSTEQMDARSLAVGRACEGLAIEGEGLAWVLGAILAPQAQGLLEGSDIELAEEFRERTLGGDLDPPESQGKSQRGTVVPTELGDGLQGLVSREDGDGGQGQDSLERMMMALGFARIRDRSQDFYQGQASHARILQGQQTATDYQLARTQFTHSRQDQKRNGPGLLAHALLA